MSIPSSERPNRTGSSPGALAQDEFLVFEGAWLRRLARQLVRDSHRAEDAVQATLVAAWSRPQGEAPPSRPWLARVLRNFVHQDARSEARRGEREAVAARGKESEPEQSTLDRLEVQRRVVDAIECLQEPYRTTIVLRFLDDLPPRVIAAQAGVPVKTVYTRIKRGLAQLRGQLSETWSKEQSGSRDWRRALLALPGVATKSTTLLSGVAAMGSLAKTGLVIAGAVLLVAGARLVFRPISATAGTELAAGTVSKGMPTQGQVEVRRPDPEGASLGTRRSSVASQEDNLAEPAPTLQGIVVDPNAAPVPGVRVTVSLGVELQEAISDAQGLFRITAPSPSGHHPSAPDRDAGWAPGSIGFRYVVQADDPNWVCLAGSFSTASELRVVVARATQLRGSVVDQGGQPLSDAKVRFDFPLALTLSLQGDSSQVFIPDIEVTSGLDGAFEMHAVAAIAGASLTAVKQGYRSSTIELSLPDDRDQVLTMLRPRAGERMLEGRVLGPDGEPFAGALVSAHAASIESDPDGWFVVQLPERGKAHLGGDSLVLTALAEGLLPARYSIDEGVPLPSFVELRLGGPSLAIAGRVIDGNGEPVEDALIWVSDLTFFGYVTKENPGISFDMPRYAEELLATQDKFPQGVYTYSDGNGHFRLKGLLDRDYSLMAMDESNLAFVELGAVPAGSSGLEIRISPSLPPVSVSGRVVGHDGLPIPFAGVVAKSIRHDRHGLPYRSQHVFTDTKGRFEFEGLVPEGLVLSVGGVDIALKLDGFPITSGDDLGGLELEVGRVVRFKLKSTEEDFAQAHFSVRDAEGQSLPMTTEIGGQAILGFISELTGGVSGVIDVEDNATTLVIEVDGRDPLLLPLRLKRGAVIEILVP